MKLNQLHYFVDVCKYGSFVVAAKQNFVSQPAIAQSIRELESEFNIVLFERNNNKLTLTENGKWLYERAVNLLSIVHNLEQDLHARANNYSSVRLGVAPMFGSLYFYKHLDSFRREFPSIRIDIEESGSKEIPRWLEQGLVDVGVCILDGISSKNIAKQKLIDAPLCFCVHKDHPLANRKSIKFTDLDGAKICLLRKDSYQNTLILQRCEQVGIQIDVIMHSSQISSISSMLAYSDCGAFLFENATIGNPSLVAIPMDPPICLPIGLIWDVRRKETAQIKQVCRYFGRKFNQ